ncbi:MAG: type II toxin-antitoxin system Phd/YefM family antitoxin [Armatimonadota bacterium]
MIDLHRVHSLTDFLRNHKEHSKRLRAIESPEVLTVNGRAEAVIQGVNGYQALLDRLEYAERLAGLRHGSPTQPKQPVGEGSFEDLQRG